MRRIVLALALLAVGASAQTKDQERGYITASGQTVTFIDRYGSGTLTLEYLIVGSPSAMSIAVQGCGEGGTCVTLSPITGTAPYTSTTSGQQTFLGGYNVYKVTPIYAGTATVSVYKVGIQAKMNSPGGTFPATPGVVCNTSTTASRNCTFSDIVPLWTGANCSGTGVLQYNGGCGAPVYTPSVGAAGVVNASTGAGTFQQTDIVSANALRVNCFADSKAAGAYTGGAATSFFGDWASKYEPQATVNNTAVIGESAQEIAAQVFGTTILSTDKSVIATATNDTVIQSGTVNDQYVHSVADLAAYAAIPDGSAVSGYPAKVKGSAIATYTGTCAASTNYSIAETCQTGATFTYSFVGDHFYLSTNSNFTGTMSLSLAFDGGAATTYGPFGYTTNGSRPYSYSYNGHLAGQTYADFLLRVPMISGGKGTYHSVTYTCTAGPCDINWVGSNAIANTQQGSQVFIANLEQEGGDPTGNISNLVDQAVTQVANELATDGLMVYKADLAGYLNYYAGPNISTTGTWSTGSPVITVVSTAGMNVGMGISLNGTFAQYIVSIGSGTITLSANPASGTSGTVTGNANWANTLHENAAGALAKSVGLGRATNPLVTALKTYASASNDYITIPISFPGLNAINGNPNTPGSVAQWQPPFPVELISMQIYQVGSLATCTSITNTASLRIRSAYTNNLTYQGFFANAYSTIIGSTLAPIGYIFDTYNDTFLFAITGYTGTGCTNGNVTLTAFANFKRL